MPLIRLHLAVDAGLGPVLWAREQTAPRRSHALVTLDPVLDALGWDLPRGPLRHRHVLPPSGSSGTRARVPALALGPGLLAEVVGDLRTRIAERIEGGDVAAALAPLISERRSLALHRAESEDEPSLAAMPDLLVGVLRDLQAEQLVAARQVRIVLEERFGQHWARWAALDENATAVLDALVDVRARAAFREHLATQGFPARGATEAPTDPHRLLAALVDPDEPLRADLPALRTMQQAVDSHLDTGRARAVLTSTDAALVVRLFEPADPRSPVWPLQTCLREEDGTVHDVASLRALGDVSSAGAAEAAAEVLRLAPTVRGAAVQATGVDWDLTTEQASRFLAMDTAALEAAGVTVLLPRTWTKQRATVRVEASEPQDEEAPKPGGGVGVQAMASFRWAVAVGDTDLTEEEIAQIREAQSELVQLRGQWIRLDAETIRAAERFLERFTGAAPSAPARPARAPTAGAPGGAELSAEASAEDAAGRAAAAVTSAATWTAFFSSLLSPEADGVELDITAALQRESGAAHNAMSRLLPGGQGPVRGASPASLQATLRPYQLAGLDWMWALHEIGLGGILADDMGLGKTMQVLALLCRERELAAAAGREHPGPTLLVCPMSVVGSWQREAARWAPGLQVHVHHGSDRVRDESFAHGAADMDLVITTYSLLDRDLEVLRRLAWHRVVFDEAQHIKNPGTAVTRAARALPAVHRLALTGTPVENRLADLHSLMEAVNPGLMGTEADFQAAIATPIEQEGDSTALSRLRWVTSPLVLRRLKTDRTIIDDLPEKIELTRLVSMTPEQAGLYEALVGELMAQIDAADQKQRRTLVGAALTRLKQVCNHPAQYLGDGSAILDAEGEHRSGKLELVDDILSTAFARGEKVLLFTQFTTFGRMLVPYWREAFGIEVPFLHGGVSKPDRDAMVEQFQGTPNTPGAMLLSLKAGGTGLTLTAANHVIHLDRWWNPAVENQATDRAFRIGQTRDVQVRKIVSAGTVEERIDQVLAEKSSLAELAVGTTEGIPATWGEGWIADLDDDALWRLLRLDGGS